MKTSCFIAAGRSVPGRGFLRLSIPKENLKPARHTHSLKSQGLLLGLFFFMLAPDILSQCTPNTIAFHGSQPIFNTACGNNSYQTIDGSVPLPNNGNQTFQWEYSLNGNPYVLISSTTIDLPKNDITDLILLPNNNATGNYAIRRIVNDNSPVCSTTSPPVFLYYAQNSGQTSGGSITPISTTSCFTANGTLTLQGHTGPIHRWEVSFNDGAWTEVSNITNLYTYDLDTDGTYCYRALIDDVCSGAVGSIDLTFDDYSEEACVSVVSDPPAITTCAALRMISGCETSVISNPSFSSTVTLSSLTVFESAPNLGVLSNNCDVSTVEYVDIVTNSNCPIIVQRTWTISDVDGNSSSCTQTINVVDMTSPVITAMAQSSMVECDGLGNSGSLNSWLENRGGSTASDLCSEVTWSNDYDQLSGLCGATGTVTFGFTATDLCNNASTTTATFTIVDTTDPLISVGAANMTVECDGGGNTSALASFLNTRGGASASDICSGVTWTNDFTSLSDLCGASGSAIVRFTATDACGNASTTTATFTIEDTTDPDITTSAQNMTVQCDGSGNTASLAAFLNTKGGAIASDACSGLTWTNDFSALSNLCGATGSTTVQFTATDACGNASTTTASFTIEDTTDPVITTLAQDMTVQCDGSGNTASLTTFLNTRGGAIANDACSGLTWTNDFTALSDLCGATGSATVHFTVTDDCGNASTTTAIFTIVDTTVPAITTAASDMTVACDGSGNTGSLATFLNTKGGAIAGDLCSEVAWSNDFTVLSDLCGATGSVTVHFTATDACGNANTTTANFTIEDIISPMITAHSMNMTVECDGAGNTIELNEFLSEHAGANASDACSELAWDHDFTALSDLCGSTGSASVHFTVTDDCGNASTTTAIFTIVDTSDPLISTVATNMTVECDGQGNTSALASFLNSQGGASASDICSGVTWTNDFTALSDLCGASGSATVRFTATDDCGNASTTTAIFTIVDTTDPVVTTPAQNMTVQCDGSGNTTAFNIFLNTQGGAIAHDACGAVTWIHNYTALSDLCGATGTTTVQFTATDACGNASTTTATFTIEDTTDPAITASAQNTTVECDGSGNSGALASFLSTRGGAAANDECSGVTWTNDFTAISNLCGATGSATVRFTATDACGNASTTTATFTIVDNSNPVIGTPASNSTVQCAPNNAATLTSWLNAHGGALASDVCGGVSWSYTPNPAVLSDLCGATGSVTVQFKATDDCGNFSTTTASFTVVDLVAPVISPGASNMVVQCNGTGNTSQLSSWLSSRGGASAADVCSGVSWTNDFVSLSDLCGATGSATVRFTATDACGNASTTTASFTIVDVTGPSITVGSGPNSVSCPDIPAFPSVTVNDLCDSSPSLIFSDVTVAGTCMNEYTVTRTWTAADICGNSSQASKTITVMDATAPVVTCPPGISISKNNQCQYDASPAITGYATAQDNCDPAPSVSYSDESCFGNDNFVSMNHGQGYYFPVTVSGFDALSAGQLHSLELEFHSNQGKGNVEFILIAPNGDGIVLVGPYCSGGFCELNDATIYKPGFYTDASGYPKWENDNYIEPGPGNFEPYGGISPNSIVGFNGNFRSRFEDLTGPMNGNWVLFGRKDGTATGTILFAGFCLTPASCTDNQLIVRTWTSTDACGNTSPPCVQTINIKDNAAPVISGLPGPSNIECFATPVFATPSISDACDTEPAFSYYDVTITSDCQYEYTVVRTWIAMDNCSNSSSATQTISVVCDEEPDPGVVNGDSPVCIGTVSAYTSTGDPGGQWSSTVPAVATVNASTGQVTALTSGTTNITYTVGSPCNGAASSFKTMTVKPSIVMNLGDDGPGSLRDVIACAENGATITFDNSLSGQTIVLSSGEIPIIKNLIIDGLGINSLTLSGNNASRIFRVYPGYDFRLEDMALKYASAASNGGALFVEGDLILKNVLFQYNYENGNLKAFTASNNAIVEIIGNVNLKN